MNTDLNNANDDSWRPGTPKVLLQNWILPTVAELDGVPFEQALPMSVETPASDGAFKADVFTDDIILVVLDDKDG
jgi:hypothetical protein